MAEGDVRRSWLNPAMIFAAALLVRALIWFLIPVDWNWDSYHHWQISYLSLRIGFSGGRLWDLNGCEYIWGMVPHLAEAALMGLLNTSSMAPYRVLNVLLGAVNAVLVQMIGARFYSVRTGLLAGLLLAVFPVAAVFDVLAMQDTMALTLLLASLYLIRDRPFWSGLSLALAGQSRAEYLAAGFIILAGYCLRERLSTDSLPYVLGWALGTGVFSFHLFTQTGNPFYHLYVSLFNVFGGFDPGNQGKSFASLAVEWVIWKLSVWPTKPTGLLILLAGATAIVMVPFMAWRRWFRYQPQLYFVAVTAFQLPIFITYLESDHVLLLIMLRMATPIAALGYPLLVHASNMVFVNKMHEDVRIRPEHILLAVSILSFLYFVPVYQGFQAYAADAFLSGDIVAAEYGGGVIVCDHPTINYRLVNTGAVDVFNLLGNHYSPAFYGISEPSEYLAWMRDRQVSMWLRYDYRSDHVWAVMEANYPEVLVWVADTPCARVYAVDKVLISELLSRGNT
ncbi:MAG: hypothetical protein ABIJ47_15180 [Candidatus Bathyarchaeota archaeon]